MQRRRRHQRIAFARTRMGKDAPSFASRAPQATMVHRTILLPEHVLSSRCVPHSTRSTLRRIGPSYRSVRDEPSKGSYRNRVRSDHTARKPTSPSRRPPSRSFRYIKKYLTCLVSTRDNSVRCTRRGQRLSSSRSSYVLLAYRRTRSQALITHHAKRPLRGVSHDE